MAKFLKIVSTSITTPEDMFTLGVTTSRGKEEKIGQFGSGSLMGTLVWMRSFGSSPVFLVNGKKVSFETKDVLKSDGEVFKQVIMKTDRKKNPLTVALEYGELDWRTADLGLREWISNAIDAGADLREAVQVVDKISAEVNEVAIFVPFEGLAKKYFENLGQHFLHYDGKQEEKVIDKITPSPCRIYRKGVFVRELLDDSLFDYNLDFSINECRTGSSDNLKNDINYHMGYHSTREQAALMLEAILSGKEVVETETYWVRVGTEMKNLLLELVGTLCLCSNTFKVANCVAIHEDWYKKITEEVPELDGLASYCEAAIRGFEVHEPTEKEQGMFNLLCETIEALGLNNGMGRPSLSMYTNPIKEAPKFRGMYTKNTQHVMVFRDVDYPRVMIHEICHHYSSADDYSKGFIDFAHKVIAEIAVQLL